MCDEFTVAGEDAALAARGLSRREFAAMSAAAAVAGYADLAAAATGPALAESMVEIATPDGKADAFFVHPARGRHPAVILWPDVLGLREVKKAMGRRLAAAGYAVLVVNPYYRAFKGELGLTFAQFRTPEGTAALSGFTQSAGYLLSAAGPFGVGALHAATGSWTPSVLLLLGLCVPLYLCGLYATGDRYVEDELARRT